MPTKSQAAIFRQAVKAISLLKEIAAAVLAKDTKKYTLTDFTARYPKLEEHKSKLENIYLEILDDDDLSDETEATYTKNFENALMDYDVILVAFKQLSVISAPSETLSMPSTPNVLPKIALPKFSSKVEDWPSFIAIFRSLTDEMTHISDAVKLHYLLSCLSGEARSMVAHLQLTGDNFAVAMEILTRRYENRRVLIDRFVDIIMGLPQIHARSDIRTLFLTPLISAQSALNNLDLPMKDCDYVFVSIVVRKLKGELRTLFERKYGSRQTLPTLKNLIAFLEEHARCVETEWSSPGPSHVNQPSPQPGPYRRQSPVASPRGPPRQPMYQQFRPVGPARPGPARPGPVDSQSFYRSPAPTQPRPVYSAHPRPVYSAQPSAQSASNNMPCPFCGERGHKLIACPQYNDQPIQGRWDFIEARNRCRRCLGPHYENECKSTRACKECGSDRHHTSLHRPGAPSPVNSSAHLLPPHLRDQPRQRPAHEYQHSSAHASQVAPPPPNNSSSHSRSPSRSRVGGQQ